jgi:hypothetical protein
VSDFHPTNRPPHRTAVRWIRWDWLLFGLLCLGTVAYWSFQYQPFVLPNNDYYSFERVATSLGNGELPRSFKRTPVFPLLMAGLSRVMPEPHPELHAALVLNMAFSIGSLVLLFWLSSRLLGAGALLVPVLFATTAQFHSMALQPLVEPSLGFFCLLTLVLFHRRSPWQYLAAAGAALSRSEASTLILVLFVLNWRADRRFWRHMALASLAAVPMLAWTAAGAVRGSGAGFYLELMKGMGWAAAPGFLLSCVQEPFAGWFVGGGVLLAPFLVLAVAPTLVGVVIGLREFRREAIAMLAFFGLSVAVIVLFGIEKPRYTYPSGWILLFFFATGALYLLETGFRHLDARLASRSGTSIALMVAASALFLLVVLLWVWYMARLPHVAPFAADLLFLALALGLVRTQLWRIRQHRLWIATCGLFLAFLTPVVAGGIASKQLGLFQIRYANYSSHLLAPWLEENLGPRDRVVLLHPTHIRFLTDLGPERFQKFLKMEAENAAELAVEMREKGLTHVAYTYRRQATNPAANFYYRRKKTHLAEEFRGGGQVAGFEHLATLPLPEILDRSAVQIYRVLQ